MIIYCGRWAQLSQLAMAHRFRLMVRRYGLQFRWYSANGQAAPEVLADLMSVHREASLYDGGPLPS